jgi:predicted DNA-binding protein (MmcQ/YjbR family)
MTRHEFFYVCSGVYGATPDYPFDDWMESAVFRHVESRKWFALALKVSRRKLGFDSDEVVDIVNLKMPTEMLGSFSPEDGVYPAYHMNKLHWISVILPDAPDGVVEFLLNASFEATKSKKKRNKNLR